MLRLFPALLLPLLPKFTDVLFTVGLFLNKGQVMVPKQQFKSERQQETDPVLSALFRIVIVPQDGVSQNRLQMQSLYQPQTPSQ